MYKASPLSLTVLLVSMIVTAGCKSGPPSLQFSGEQSNRLYSQTFTRTYYRISEGGEYDIILNEDGIMPAPMGKSGPLSSAATAVPLSQTVHIRVRWRPQRGTKPDAPTATNAVIDWYVQSNEPGRQGDRLHYRGAGFVSIYGSGVQSRFVVRNARLELTASAGRLNDPLGPAALTGDFLATRNDGMVSSTLSQLREQFAARPAAAPNGYDGPPPRLPSGP